MQQDKIKGHMWLNLAATRGDTEARELRDKLSSSMKLEEIITAQKKAGAWKPLKDRKTISEEAAGNVLDKLEKK